MSHALSPDHGVRQAERDAAGGASVASASAEREARDGLAVTAETSAEGPGGAGEVFAPDRWLVRKLLEGLGNPAFSIVLWNGEEIAASAAPPVARLRVCSRGTLLKLMVRPCWEFAEAYSSRRVEVEGDLLELLMAVYRSMAHWRRPAGLAQRALWKLDNWLHANTPAGSKRNIHHHYDIGNDFYKLWLDEQLLYTCAYFPTPTAGLEEAQRAKMDHVARKVWLKPGEKVAEAGCGWGSLALHLARHYGVSVRAFNISHEQIVYARARAKAEGLDGRVEFVEDDYRNMSGHFDAFVSVGMLEHVGPDHYHDLVRTIDRVLGPAGRGLIHSIGQNVAGWPLNPWIRRRIFPGAYPPGLREMAAMLEPCSFSVLDVENLRLHYAETLRHWLARFNAAEDRVVRMFDPAFVRAWRLYLTGSQAAFLCGNLQLFQLVFARCQSNAIPWTRAYLYQSLAPAAG
jgi:cyclopropane-fatty-acyl-phospholipid synthase